MSTYPDGGRSVRRILGLLLLLASPMLALGARYSAQESLTSLARMERHRTPADSLAYASASYHASHARAREANRWHASGYATLGVAGTVVGLGLLVSGLFRRSA